jgi:hypothetical protein
MTKGMLGLVSAAALMAACTGAIFPAVRRLAIVKPQQFSIGIVDEFPDGQPAEPVSAGVFEQINRDRGAEGLAPVRWDAKAASLAEEYTREQIREGTIGHFLLDGVPPYARLSRQGDLGVGAENSVAYVFSGDHIDVPPLTLALNSHRDMLAEMPPNDGHRRAILDPAATHVGVGWSLVGGNFRMTEEFTSRRFDWLRVVRLGSDGSSIRVRGHALPGMSIAFVSVARQPIPSALSLEEVNARRSYSYPSPHYALVPAASRTIALGLISLRCLTPSIKGHFSFNYQIDEPGLWTFILYFDHKGEPRPAPGGSFTVWVDEERPSVLRS